jgi:flagellar L-ring protein precursor FlgH
MTKRAIRLIRYISPAFVTSAIFAQTAPQQPIATPSAQSQQRVGPNISIATPTDTAQTTAALLHSNGGSLLRASLAAQPDPSVAKASQVSFFAVPAPEPRTLKKHDLVTIIVREESEAKSEGTSDLKKNADLDAKIEQFPSLNLSGSGGVVGNGIGATAPEIKLSGTRNMKGEATVNRSDSLTLRVQAEIVDVKPNNTLVLQARATVTMDEEIQTIVLSGTCRAEDVTPDNTVLSTQLYDKSVVKSTKGSVRDTTKRGWVPRLLDVLNPF